MKAGSLLVRKAALAPLLLAALLSSCGGREGCECGAYCGDALDRDLDAMPDRSDYLEEPESGESVDATVEGPNEASSEADEEGVLPEPVIHVDRCDEGYSNCTPLDGEATPFVMSGKAFLVARLENVAGADSVSWTAYDLTNTVPCESLGVGNTACALEVDLQEWEEILSVAFVVSFAGDTYGPIGWARVLPVFRPDPTAGGAICLEHGPWVQLGDVIEPVGGGTWAAGWDLEQDVAGRLVEVGIPEPSTEATACRLTVGRYETDAWSWQTAYTWPRDSASGCAPSGILDLVTAGDDIFVAIPTKGTWADLGGVQPGEYQVGRIGVGGAVFETVTARDVCAFQWPEEPVFTGPVQIAVGPEGAIHLFAQVTADFAVMLSNETGAWACQSFFDSITWNPYVPDPTADVISFGEAELAVDGAGRPRLALVLPDAGIVVVRREEGSWLGNYEPLGERHVQWLGAYLDREDQWNLAATSHEDPNLVRVKFTADDQEDRLDDLAPLLMTACQPPYCVCSAWYPYDPSYCGTTQSAMAVTVDAAGRTHALVGGSGTPSAYVTNLHGPWTVDVIPEFGYRAADAGSSDHFAGNPVKLFVGVDGALHAFYFDGKMAQNGEAGSIRHWMRPCTKELVP